MLYVTRKHYRPCFGALYRETEEAPEILLNLVAAASSLPSCRLLYLLRSLLILSLLLPL
jgi:hypothetical protein